MTETLRYSKHTHLDQLQYISMSCHQSTVYELGRYRYLTVIMCSAMNCMIDANMSRDQWRLCSWLQLALHKWTGCTMQNLSSVRNSTCGWSRGLDRVRGQVLRMLTQPTPRLFFLWASASFYLSSTPYTRSNSANADGYATFTTPYQLMFSGVNHLPWQPGCPVKSAHQSPKPKAPHL